MSGIFKLSDKNKTQSGPSSLSTPTRRSHGLFMGNQQDGAESSYGGFHTPQSFGACPSSPATQGRSLREYEDQMTVLRKDNFNLKLRIYFLEEKPAANTTGEGNDNFYKQNIDLKVENESLHKELQEKQELLCQASTAMDLLDKQQKQQYEKSQLIIDDLNHKIEMMNVAEFELVIRSFNDQNEQLCQKIEQMENDRRDMTRKNNQLSYENAEFKEKLEENEKYFGNNNELKKLQDESYENKRRLTDAIAQLDELEKKLQEKCGAHEKSLSVIQKACEHIEDLELHVEQLKSSQPNSLSSTESAKNDEIFTHANGVILKLRKEIEQITTEKNEEIHRLKDEMRRKSRNSHTFTPICNSSAFNLTHNSSQQINFPTNETSFNDVIEKNRSAQKRIHFLKQKLCSTDVQNKIEVELLQLQLKEAQDECDESEAALKQSTMFCGILMERLEELARFLNTLLKQKDIIGQLGAELRKAITKAVDRSLDLSRSVNIDESMEQSAHLSDLSMVDFVDSLASSTFADEKLLRDNHRIENQKLKNELEMFKFSKGIHPCSSINRSHKIQKSVKKSVTSMFLKQHSESEEWSEPDRDVSKKRIGLKTDDSMMSVKRSSTTSEEDEEFNILEGFTGDHKLVKKSEWKQIQEKIRHLEALLTEKNDKILEVQCSMLDVENDAKEKVLQLKKKLDETEKDLQHYKKLYQELTTEVCDYKQKFTSLNSAFKENNDVMIQLKKDKDHLNVELRVMSTKHDSQVNCNRELKMRFREEEEKHHNLQLEYDSKCEMFEQLLTASEKRETDFKDDLQQNWIRKNVYNQLLHELEKKQEKLKDYQQKFADMEEDLKMMHSTVVANEGRIERISQNLDNATLQLSAASVERSRALSDKRVTESRFKKLNEDHQKLNFEKQELNLKIAELEVFSAKLQNKLLIGEKVNIPTQQSSDASGYASEEAIMNAPERSPSFSSNDEKNKEIQIQGIPSDCTTCKVLEQEVVEVKKNLSQSKRSLEQAYAKLRTQNLRKAQVEKDIKQQILKTQNVLQNVRVNMETELNRGSGSIKKD
ncbi:unnamed protein product [Diamesa tonsa]